MIDSTVDARRRAFGCALVLGTWLLSTACDAGTESRDPEMATGGATGGSGSGMGGGGGSAASEPPGTFTLLYRDDFDQLDPSRWQLMTHSWNGNLALFSPETASVQDGQLVIRLLPAPQGTVDSTNAPKAFLGAEVRSLATLTYGRVRARARLAKGSAVISSLVTIYTPWPADNWNELDIEYLGATPEKVQFNTMVYTGPPQTPPVTQAVTPTQDPHMEMLGFDASTDFHTYTIEWTPVSARFFVDDELRYTWTKNIALMTLPQNVLLTIWASSTASWAGPVTDTTGQASASYDWIELYQYSER